MAKLTLQSLGRRLQAKRGSRGLREVAKEIGISSATLSRVENGHLPDLLSFEKICHWLEVDPGQFLGKSRTPSPAEQPAVHFRMERVVSEETAQALARMILAAQRALQRSADGHA